jgi:hypothetical protein
VAAAALILKEGTFTLSWHRTHGDRNGRQMSCCDRRFDMKKVVVLMLVGGVVWAAVARGKRQQDGPQPSMWDKMRQHMEDMPEDFPPRVMFDNAAAARENTERILEILGEGGRVANPEGGKQDE